MSHRVWEMSIKSNFLVMFISFEIFGIISCEIAFCVSNWFYFVFFDEWSWKVENKISLISMIWIYKYILLQGVLYFSGRE